MLAANVPTAASQLSIQLIVTGTLQAGISDDSVLSVCLNVLIFILGGKSQSVPATAVAALCRDKTFVGKSSIGMVV